MSPLNAVNEPLTSSSLEIARRELRGVVVTPDGGDAVVAATIYDGDARIGVAHVERGSNDGVSRRWYLRWALVPDLYDGEIHDLRVVASDRGERVFESAITFVGDAAVVLPPRINRVPRLSAPAPLPPSAPAPAPATNERALAAAIECLGAQTQALTAFIGRFEAVSAPAALPPPAAAAPRMPLALHERHGEFVYDAAVPRAGRDMLWFGVIDWDFRIQRPQHLCTNLADLQNRVFYISIVFEPADERGRFRVLRSPHPGVYEVRLRLCGTLPENIYGELTPEQIAEMLAAIDEMLATLNLREPVAVVEYPSWYRVATGIPGATVVHDCLDLISGFDNTPPMMLQLEDALVRNADLVVTASQPLADHLGERRGSTVIRNAADVQLFGDAKDAPARAGRRPVIGYFGAIAHWYEIEWIEHCARRHPEWDFVLIGSTTGAEVGALETLANVKLLGERPYGELPGHLSGFDVAVIPFKTIELITCTNPVKLYEYMAAGKPVVASPMPEVVAASDLVYIAHDAKTFEQQIQRALVQDGPKLRAQRRRWAERHSWRHRASDFLAALDRTSPRVSVVVLAYNNWSFTRACLLSVLRWSDYENLEVIVVDNGSSDGTPQHLEREFGGDARVRVILNADNLGYAAGNNVGIRAAGGDIVILLNNDTYVTRGWIRDLIRPLQQDPRVGLTVPLTNNMGNEQKIAIAYADMQQMSGTARRFVRERVRERLEIDTVAFFCVALTRAVIDDVGLLDEAYGLGFFEDDDYCRRVARAGYRMTIVDDVFVHHHLSASFNALGAERKREQMQRNKALYESRWGAWTPHTYRDEPGFG